MSELKYLLLNMEAKLNELYDERATSQSQLKVYREALEEIVGMEHMDGEGLPVKWPYGKYDASLSIARAALSTNPSLEEETK